MKRSVKYIRKAAIAVAGGLLILIGIPLIPLPGPGFLVVFAGVFVLSLEFDWFKPHVERTRKMIKSTMPKKKNPK